MTDPKLFIPLFLIAVEVCVLASDWRGVVSRLRIVGSCVRQILGGGQ